MTIHFLGIRHHSPACAKLVKQQIATLQPTAVLVEGPCDFNQRIDELLLAHNLPIALYSYNYNGETTAQSWFPFLAYSPELVALQEAKKIGADSYFIDLPHWCYRVRSSLYEDFQEHLHTTDNNTSTKDRYEHVINQLLKTTGHDNQHALWDSWFEHAPTDTLKERLDTYFQTLRGDYKEENENLSEDPSEEWLREHFMALWINHIANKLKQTSLPNKSDKDSTILVICGGWHVEALKHLTQADDTQNNAIKNNAIIADGMPNPTEFIKQHTQQVSKILAEDAQKQATNLQPNDSLLNDQQNQSQTSQGSYLIPYEYRQIDAMLGYGAGMPSPQYYEWLYNDTNTAYQQAIKTIVSHLRDTKQQVGTADLIAWEHTSQSLARLRGHSQPTRNDLLDGFLNSCIKEAIGSPPPWSEKSGNARLLQKFDHPAFIAVLTALTGNKRGQLAKETPLPPLVANVHTLLATMDMLPSNTTVNLSLNWRKESERKKLQVLWQLHCIGCSSVRLLDTKGLQTRQNPRQNPQQSKKNHGNHRLDGMTRIDAEETWCLKLNQNWDVELIEASRFGATLATATQTALSEKLILDVNLSNHATNHPTSTSNSSAISTEATVITQVFTLAIRVGLSELHETLLHRLIDLLPQLQDRDSLVKIGHTLKNFKQQGFWGTDIDVLITQPLVLVIQYLAWLLDGESRHSTTSPETDIQAMKLFEYTLSYEFIDELTANTQTDTTINNGKGMEQSDMLELLSRIIYDDETSPTLKGSALGVYQTFYEKHDYKRYDEYEKQAETNITTNTKIPSINTTDIVSRLRPNDQLGDFLYGLFACARQLLTRHTDSDNKDDNSDDDKNNDDKTGTKNTGGLLKHLHNSLTTIAIEDFMTALPALRMAFSWFSAKERQAMAQTLADYMGLSQQDKKLFSQQLNAPANSAINDEQVLIIAKQIEAKALHWLAVIDGNN